MISVLYVDDETSLLDVTKIYIEHTGEFSVDTTPSARTALTIMDKRMYDAVISDYQMPDMDGIEFLKKVRSSGNSIPFIIFTGKGREEVVIEALNAGADFYLQKGGDPRSQFTELAHKIRQAVQQRSAAMRIRDLEQREMDTLNFLPDPTFAVDRDGRVIAWNYAMEVLTGTKAADMIGEGNYEYARSLYGTRRPVLIDLVHSPPDEIRAHYSGVNIERDRITGETKDASPGGKHLVLHASASALYDADGAVTGAIETIHDVTARRMLQDALTNANRQLNLLSQITRHDIVNRISVCLGYIELAKEESDDPRMHSHIANIEKTISDIRRQIEFTRLYHDLGVRAPEWQDVEEILSQCHSRPGLAAIDLGGAEVYADSMLPKVFSNLMDNTLRYSGDQATVTVCAAECEGALIISWKDTGAGVPADEKEKIFERGYGKNTGLGLFLAREILGITGISIREAGEPGKGARFEIIVPPGAYRYRE